MLNKNDPVAKKVLAYTESKEFEKGLTMIKIYCKTATIKERDFG